MSFCLTVKKCLYNIIFHTEFFFVFFKKELILKVAIFVCGKISVLKTHHNFVLYCDVALEQ